jgi:hypothetical protein
VTIAPAPVYSANVTVSETRREAERRRFTSAKTSGRIAAAVYLFLQTPHTAATREPA